MGWFRMMINHMEHLDDTRVMWMMWRIWSSCGCVARFPFLGPPWLKKYITVVWCQTTSTIDDKYKDEDDYNSSSSTRSSASASTIRTKISTKTTANNLWPKIHCTFRSTWTYERETKCGAEWGCQKLETRLPAIKRTTSTGEQSGKKWVPASTTTVWYPQFLRIWFFSRCVFSPLWRPRPALPTLIPSLKRRRRQSHKLSRWQRHGLWHRLWQHQLPQWRWRRKPSLRTQNWDFWSG